MRFHVTRKFNQSPKRKRPFESGYWIRDAKTDELTVKRKTRREAEEQADEWNRKEAAKQLEERKARAKQFSAEKPTPEEIKEFYAVHGLQTVVAS